MKDLKNIDMNDLKVVSNDQEIDNQLIGSTAEPACIIKVDDWIHEVPLVLNGVSYPTVTKPIGAYLDYISKTFVPDGVSHEHTFTKKKGFHHSWNTSIEVKATAGGNIMGCDVSLEVTTGFTYGSEISVETEESWKDTITGPVDLWTFQPVLMYCTRVENNSAIEIEMNKAQLKWWKDINNEFIYFLTPVYRNVPTIVSNQLQTLDPNEFMSYLSGDGISKWFTEVEYQGEGYLQHVGSKKYMAVNNGHPIDGAKMVLYSKVDRFILDNNGYLYHPASNKYVCAKDGATAASTTLILYHTPGDGANRFFNTYQITSKGRLIHNGSKMCVVLQNAFSDDCTPFILHADGGDWNNYKFVPTTLAKKEQQTVAKTEKTNCPQELVDS